MSEINPNDYNVRWYHRRLPDAINASKKSYSKRRVWEDATKAKTHKGAFKIPRDIEFYSGAQNSNIV